MTDTPEEIRRFAPGRVSDFRSDTVTRPTPRMCEAMAMAAVGDDGFGDDPTVKELEELASQKVGMESAVFMASGVMANQAAICVHTRPGDEILCEDLSHIPWFEGAGAAVNARVQIRTYELTEDRLEPAAAERLLRLPIIDCPRTTLLCVENTHNMRGGIIWPQDNLDALKDWAVSKGIKVHLDGARLFNAAAASGKSAAQIAEVADSVMFCLSKGLGAPIGSILAGKADFIDEARRVRKRLGGQMRQVGVIAAAGLIALTEGAARLEEDHALAATIHESLAGMEDLSLAQSAVQTNILFYQLTNRFVADDVVARLEEKGVLICPFTDNKLRIVTHRDVDAADGERLVAGLQEILQ